MIQTKTRETMKTTLTKGQRFFYTGDRANLPTFGIITEVTQYGYVVIYDKKRFEDDSKTGLVAFSSFVAGIGNRFLTIEDYNAKRVEKLAKYGYKETEIELAK